MVLYGRKSYFFIGALVRSSLLIPNVPQYISRKRHILSLRKYYFQSILDHVWAPLALFWILEGCNFTPTSWFSLNNSEQVKAVSLEFAAFSNNLLENFVSNLVILPHPSLQILSKTQTGVFLISGFFVNPLQKETIDNINMKLAPVTKIGQINKTSKRNDDDVMSESCNVIAIFWIYGQFGEIRKPDSKRIVCKTYILINSNVLKKSLRQFSHYCFE